MNYFEAKNVADRYEKGRPYFHPTTIGEIKSYLKLTKKKDRALDVACGTGLSTIALLDLAEQVYATDISIEMLNKTLIHDKIEYCIAKAEQQPFPDNYFDLITVSSGVHWFDIDNFLIEANRILVSNSYLVIYDNYLNFEMQYMERFSSWLVDNFRKKYPFPQRNNDYRWTNENLSVKNFRIDYECQFNSEIIFTIERLIFYLTSLSSITKQIESGLVTYKEVEDWLYVQLKPFFDSDSQKIIFGNRIKYIQKVN